jgi:cell wall-associated NlpC family hydrolase
MICTALALLLIVSSTAVGAKASGDSITTHIGTVNASSLRLRSGPSTSSATIAYAPRGDYAVVIGKTGSWYQVIYNLKTGYMHESYLITNTIKNIELGYGKVNATRVNLRTGPGTSYSSIGKANTGDKAYIIGLNNQWYKVIFGSSICYIRSDYLDLTEIPYENAASTKKPVFFVDGKSTGVAPSASALKGETTKASEIIAEAKRHIGTPYVWGGTTTKGFDCSGYTQYVMKRCGITIPRTTTEQYKIGTFVSKSNLQPGDLVFLQNTYREGISHVGIYIGDGKMIHASSSKGVVISDLSSSYYVEHYYGARRIL